MIESKKVNKILYGGDYNPEQWPEEIWEEDMRMFKLAHIDVVTLNVFSWAALQPDETTYDFTKLDKIMEYVRKNGLKICLATSTAAHPAWMARKYPDILRTEYNGMKRKFGSRHNSCPNSPTYRKYSVALAEQLAKRYHNYDNIVAWHISNEYGGECYCENCEKAFRVWLQKKYHTIDELNRVWNTSFWGHTFYDWDDVVLPDLRSEEFSWDGKPRTNFQGISLDYRRFNSDSLLECFKLERDVVKQYTPDIPVTTNLMGCYQPLDYQKWGKEMDFVSWDSYPAFGAEYAHNAMVHDVMRGVKHGKTFALMEQTPSVSNWHTYCALKRPGVMRLLSYQALAHGSDTVMFFQMRRSIGACEKYHGAVIDHVGTENTRVFREIAALGAELENLEDTTLAARTKAKIAIVFDWDNWWATTLSAGPSEAVNYYDEVYQYYRTLFQMHIPVDMVSVEEDLSGYQVLIAPLLYMCKDGYDEKIRKFVSQGGTFVTTYFSGYVEDHDLVITGGYPGRLRDILGIWVEESDAIPVEDIGLKHTFTYDGKQYPAEILCDLLHLEGAKSLASYDNDFYAGMPAVTRNSYGNGKAYYVATRSNADFYRGLFERILGECEITPLVTTEADGNDRISVEACVRENQNGTFLFLLNHSEKTEKVTLKSGGTDLLNNREYQDGETIELAAKDVALIKQK